jgi:hypothetical protein
MEELVVVLPELDKWKEIQSIDKSKFDIVGDQIQESQHTFMYGVTNMTLLKLSLH